MDVSAALAVLRRPAYRSATDGRPPVRRLVDVVRALDRHHVYELWNAGARDIIRETFDSSLRAGRSALEALGVHPYDAERQVRGYMINDREQMYELAAVFDPDVPAHENPEYVEGTKRYLERYKEAMRGNSAAFGSRLDRGWVPPTLDDVEAEKKAAESAPE